MRPEYATVVDVIQGKGVKIKKDGEKEALDIYYNNLGAVNIGDKVYIKYTSGSILVVGKVHSGNTDTGGGSSTGVTKEYVDTQDAELSRQINVLSTNKAEKKYVDEQDLKSMNYKALIDNTRLYMTTQTGIYLTPASGVTDLPEGWAQGRHTLVCFNPNNDLYGFQLITTYAGSSGIGNNRKFAIRHAITEGSKWLELANTEKTDILCTPSSGYKITSQGSCVINNIVYLSITIEKSDGGIIPQNALVAIVPSAYKPTNGLKSADSVTLAGTSVNGVASCLVSTTGNIQYTGTATNTTKLLINTQYVI